jgi:hypothetical protein
MQYILPLQVSILSDIYKSTKTIDDLLSDIITKNKVTIEEKRKFIEEQFMEIKNKVSTVANKVIQKKLFR